MKETLVGQLRVGDTNWYGGRNQRTETDMSILFTKQWKSVYLAGLTVGVTQFDYQEMNGGIGYRSSLSHILSACKGHLEFVQRCLQLSYFRTADAIVVERLVQHCKLVTRILTWCWLSPIRMWFCMKICINVLCKYSKYLTLSTWYYL